MKFNIECLTGIMLDLAVANLRVDAVGPAEVVLFDGELVVIDSVTHQKLNYTSDEKLADAILRNEKYSIELFKDRPGQWRCFDFQWGNVYSGHTRTVAGLRCYVSSTLKADEVELPCLTVGFRPGYTPRDPLVPGPDHLDNWFDRMDDFEFIADVADHSGMNPKYYYASLAEHDRHRMLEAALWWM